MKPRTRGSDLNTFIGGVGTGAGLTAGGLNILNKKVKSDASKRRAKARKSKEHMYPPPKRKRSKSNMYPPPKRKKRSSV